jgi:phenylpropionate dioxygenase-like ring-hydroxylating dioxygenase large terminal subunit
MVEKEKRLAWYAVLPSDELKAHKPQPLRRFGQDLVIYRTPAGVPVVSDTKCPHRGASLAAGELGKNGELQCPFHGIRFAPDGTATSIPANGESVKPGQQFCVHCYETREKHGFIWVWYGEKLTSYPEIPWFANLPDGIPYRSLTMVWRCHYTRCLENQLDVVHIPFVHRKTIGRGGATVVNGPYVEQNEQGMIFSASNEKERGQVAKSMKEMVKPDFAKFHIEVLWPNIWQNYLLPTARVTIAFVPVDEHNSLLYIRYYHTMPLIGPLVRWVGTRFSFKIANEDRTVVETQSPDKTSLHMGEHLLEQDSPIIMYRKYREEHGLY